jgi:hypothetical protein
MATDRENFENWFVRPLKWLYEDKHCGCIILMSTLPLLDRYVRQKEEIRSDGLSSQFYERFAKIFPEIGEPALVAPFWRVFRHGLLHRGTFETRSGGRPVRGMLIGIGTAPLAVDSKTDLFFRLDAELFSLRVLETILNDFEVYSRTGDLLTTMTISSPTADYYSGTAVMDATLVPSGLDITRDKWRD